MRSFTEDLNPGHPELKIHAISCVRLGIWLGTAPVLSVDLLVNASSLGCLSPTPILVDWASPLGAIGKPNLCL